MPNRENAAARTGNDLVAQAVSQRRFLLTDGPVTLEPVPNMIRLPPHHEQRAIDYHAVGRDSLGRIYVLYNSVECETDSRALARFLYHGGAPGEEKFVFDACLGTRDWTEGTPHGLN